jgi:hypothetical protein
LDFQQAQEENVQKVNGYDRDKDERKALVYKGPMKRVKAQITGLVEKYGPKAKMAHVIDKEMNE